jgi:hypothetical protein
MRPLSLALRLGGRLARPLPVLVELFLLLGQWDGVRGVGGGRFRRRAFRLFFFAFVLAPQCLGLELVPVTVEVLEPKM